MVAEANRTRRCALCDTPIGSSNNSKEHIIPNAIGGRKTVSGFICANCNSKSGAKWDHELFVSLKPLCTLMDIRRQGGKNQPIPIKTLSGDEFVLQPGGGLTIPKPIFSQRDHATGKEIEFSASSEKEARQILKNLKKKYPHISIEDSMKNMQIHKTYPEEPMKISIHLGGLDAGRSIVKSCLALAFAAGFDICDAEHARAYLLEDGKPCFDYFYETDLVANRPSDVFFHCVFVQADPNSNSILAYVEYFGIQRMVFCLSNQYSGEPFSVCYAIDPETGKELDIKVNLDLTPCEVTDIYSSDQMDRPQFFEAINKFMIHYMKKATENAMSAAIHDALEDAMSELGMEEGQEMNEEDARRLAGSTVDKLTPFLLHLLRQRRFTREEILAIEADRTRGDGSA